MDEHGNSKADSSAATPSDPHADLSWQHLVPLAASLAAVTTSQELIAKVVECTVNLLNAEEAGLALCDPESGRYRMAGVAGPRTTEQPWMHVGDELAPDLPLVLRALAYDVVVLSPDDDAASSMATAIPPNGNAIHVILRHGSEVLGLLYALRVGGPPFGAGGELLARGIADETARSLVALRTPNDPRTSRNAHTEILANIAHELRAPLTTILGCGDLLQTGVEAADVAHCAELIQNAGWMLSDVVDDVIAFGRVTAGGSELVMTPLSLPTFWNTMADRCARLATRQSVELRWSRKVPIVDLVTDADQLGRVLWQLVGNAVKFTEHGMVRVTARADGADLRVQVTDSGPGIPPEHRESIFEPFWQADASTTRSHGGLGLGLYLARHALQRLGGSMTIESAARGTGSIFTVTLPRALRRPRESMIVAPTVKRGGNVPLGGS